MRFSIVLLLIIVLFAICHLPPAVLAQSPDERALLETELARLEKQIDQYEDELSGYKKQGRTLTGEISKLNSQIAKIIAQRKAIELEIKKLDLDIDKNKHQVAVTRQNLDEHKRVLAATIRDLYERDRQSVVFILLAHETLSSFFGTMEHLVSVQENLNRVIEKINQLQNQLLDQQEQLALRKNDKKVLAQYQAQQRAALEGARQEKSTLLSTTKGKESEYQKLVTETRKTAAQIRSRLFQFLGGGELSFGDAYKLAKTAEDAVGVRAALTLAVLDRESALGQNVGRCKYQEAMHPRRDIPLFLRLMGELGISPDSVTVSCANRDGMYGGAMGPAQFIPSTWFLYRDQISELTSHRPANPWTNVDAFMATALYLKNAGATTNDVSQNRVAAAKYYAGSRWRSHLWGYGERVISRARQFEEDIAELNT